MSADVTINNQKICLECNRQFTGIVAACPHDGTLLVNVVKDPLLGTTLAGNYEIQEVIGHGGMGVVYKARHTLMERTVAIKMLLSTLISDSMSVKRFQQESKAAGRIKHPHIITTYDFGISPQGQPYIVMDFLEGIALSDVIKREGQVSVERATKILAQACDALEHAHKQGVIHRDLKPTNIVLIDYDDDKDFVKVVDFGVAKLMEVSSEEGQRLTQAGEVCGSPVYMSPEQCTGHELDARSDIYSMGIVIYETLTGKLPLLGKTMVETMSKHISEAPPPFKVARPDLYIPARLEAVCLKALAKDPIDRHQSMDDLRKDLEMAIPRPGQNPALRSATISGADSAEKQNQKKASVGIISMVAAAVVGVIGIGLFALNRPAAHTESTPQSQTQPAPAAGVGAGTGSGSGTGPAADGKPPVESTNKASDGKGDSKAGDGKASTASDTKENLEKTAKDSASPGKTKIEERAEAVQTEVSKPVAHPVKKPVVAAVVHKKPPTHPAVAAAAAPPAHKGSSFDQRFKDLAGELGDRR